MFSIFEISGSALRAQSQRMNVTASNLANTDSVVGPDGQPYRARQVIFEARPLGGSSSVGGVQVTKVTESDAPFRLEYRPGHPLANESGYVRMPNVEPVNEMVNMTPPVFFFESTYLEFFLFLNLYTNKNTKHV